MIGKLIILGIIIVTAIILVPNLTKNPSLHSLEIIADKVLPNSNTKNQTLTDIKPVNLDQLDPKYVNRQTFVGQVFDKSDGTCKISVPGLADTINNKAELTHILDLQNCQYKIGDPVSVSKLEPKENIPVPINQPNSITVDPYPIPSDSGNSNSINSVTSAVPAYYNIVQLTASNKGNDVTINYDDTSGKTIDVTVTLRNSEKEIFSGKFTSSQFQTLVNDVPNTPHIIDMTVDSSVYGTLHASVYAPANSQNSIISGIFTKP
ncbi:MAG: hypothetical protein HY222_05350 [Thaumarchaeota archaeon]|nr:hypothetical protein [Nitrososphaerota archaeon]MBI3641802.1 hypothetical protein [Nitrososphaerota archaeon]